MPLVLVMVRSSPRQLQSIEWAVAGLDGLAGETTLHGQEEIWVPELVTDEATSGTESFAAGTPTEVALEPRPQEGGGLDA